MNVIGLDIGGANLKAADGHGWARSVPFALWREPNALAAAIGALLQSAPAADRLAVTMTGELCDCFRTKTEGVRQILAAVDKAIGGRQTCVYLIDGRLASMEEARDMPQLAAASNWHALARFACRFVPVAQCGLMIDIGSTTTDLVLLSGRHPCPRGLTDTDRLLAGELVYTGVARTPICAVIDSLPWKGKECPVAAELFATTADAYVTLGDLQEVKEAPWTADGRPLTREFARERLARMICADRTQFSDEDAIAAAGAIRSAQLKKLRLAFQQVIARTKASIETVVISGAGEFLARSLITEALPSARVVSMSREIGPAASLCSPAHALAVLAAEDRSPISRSERA
jgi:probable H4MPT-linked C1 transfer pathway protein